MNVIYLVSDDGQAQMELIFLSEKQQKQLKKTIKWKENKKMVDVRDAAKFLASLYFKVENDYKCDKPKIEKMLSISQIIKMTSNSLLFDADIISKDCGFGIKELAGVVFTNVHNGIIKNEPIYDTIKDEENPYIYQLDSEIDNDNKVLLTNTFRRFGSYNPQDLGKYLNEFKSNIIYNNIVDINKVYFFFKDNDGESFSNNPIFQYIIEEKNKISR